MRTNLKFTVDATCGEARLGRLCLGTQSIATPAFMPVGTLGPIKALDAADLANLGFSLTLANAYHLMLRPGAETVAAMGGLQGFCGTDRTFLTDSGGFQAFSLAKRCRIDDRGLQFASHIDGDIVILTPERLVSVQEMLAPNIAMVLDHCPHAHAPKDAVVEAMRRTTLWAEACLRARQKESVDWFGIVQGATFEDLRASHIDTIAAMDFAGFAIGGVSVGENTDDIARIVRFSAPRLPRDKPRYLMGVGTPDDLVRGVASGIDMFDCVMPSRNARNGQLFVGAGRINIKSAAFKTDDAPIEEGCPCPTCKTVSRSYLRHLFMARELTFFRLATLHNLSFYGRLMAKIRQQLKDGTFNANAFLAVA